MLVDAVGYGEVKVETDCGELLPVDLLLDDFDTICHFFRIHVNAHCQSSSLPFVKFCKFVPRPNAFVEDDRRWLSAPPGLKLQRIRPSGSSPEEMTEDVCSTPSASSIRFSSPVYSGRRLSHSPRASLPLVGRPVFLFLMTGKPS